LAVLISEWPKIQSILKVLMWKSVVEIRKIQINHEFSKTSTENSGQVFDQAQDRLKLRFWTIMLNIKYSRVWLEYDY
jgi:hypothetical protein